MKFNDIVIRYKIEALEMYQDEQKIVNETHNMIMYLLNNEPFIELLFDNNVISIDHNKEFRKLIQKCEEEKSNFKKKCEQLSEMKIKETEIPKKEIIMENSDSRNTGAENCCDIIRDTSYSLI